MKTLLYLPFIVILSCSREQTKPKSHTVVKEQVQQSIQVDNSEYYTTKDTQLIIFDTGDTLQYSKEAFNQIVDNNPEFFWELIRAPDINYYYCKADMKGFGSEAGKDEYYMLYAYFLKQKNGIDEYHEQRQRLIDIYSNINSFFQLLKNGGTYYGHQALRILGYVEYTVHFYKRFENQLSKVLTKTKEKDTYVQSLRQLIEDQSRYNFNTFGQEEAEKDKELNKIVDKIDSLITNRFYLKRTQQFQHEYYRYH